MLPDGRADFDDFISAYPRHRNLQNNQVARDVFDYLNELSSIAKMIGTTYSQRLVAGLAPCIPELEQRFLAQRTTFDFVTDRQSRQAVGSMARVILKPFGFDKKRIPGHRVDSKARITSRSITVGKVYERTNPGRINLVSTLSVLPVATQLTPEQSII